MILFSKFITRVAFGALLLAFVGCNEPNSKQNGFSALPSEYQGIASLFEVTHTQQNNVTLKIRPESHDHWVVEVTEKGERFLPPLLSIRIQDPKTIWIENFPVSNFNLILKNDSDSDCYKSESPFAIFCANQNSFIFEITLLTEGNHLRIWSQQTSPVTEGIVSQKSEYSIEELRYLSVQSGFITRMQFEKWVQARGRARAAYLSLAPRLSLSAAVTILTGDVFGFFGAAGELLPFLVPSSRVHVRQENEMALAEGYSQKILQLDTALQVESHANLSLRDEKIIFTYQSLIEELKMIRDRIEQLEVQGRYPSGSTLSFDKTLNQWYRDFEALKYYYENRLEELAMLVGFSNVESVRRVYWQDEKYPIQNPYPLHKQQGVAKAIGQSFELRQLSVLIDVARLEVTKSYWSWLNPSENIGLGLGFPNRAIIEVSKAKINELQIQNQQLLTSTQEKAYHTYEGLKLFLEMYNGAARNLIFQEQIKRNYLEQIAEAKVVDCYAFIGEMKELLLTQIQLHTAEAQYRISRAQAFRLFREQGYQDLIR